MSSAEPVYVTPPIEKDLAMHMAKRALPLVAPAALGTIASCTCDPGLRADSKPSPNSTPLIAGMESSAPTSRAPRRSSGLA